MSDTRTYLCKCGCGKPVVSVMGKQPKEFYSRACSKRYQRATRDKQPETSTGDKTGGAIATPDKRSSILGDPQAPKSGEIAVRDRTGANWGSISGNMIYADWVASGCEARGEPVPDYAQPSQMTDAEVMARGTSPDLSKVIHDDPLADVETGPDTSDSSQCYKDSGIPLPGDPGYQGVCKLVDGRWQLDLSRKRMSHADERNRYARA